MKATKLSCKVRSLVTVRNPVASARKWLKGREPRKLAKKLVVQKVDRASQRRNVSFDRTFPAIVWKREKASCTRTRRRGRTVCVGARTKRACAGRPRGERIINDVLEKFRGKVLLSRAMADLLSSRADAYARFYFRVRARQGVVQRPVSVHLLFFSLSLSLSRSLPRSPRHRRAAGTRSFSSSAIKNSSGASRLFEIAGGTRQVHIFLRRHR